MVERHAKEMGVKPSAVNYKIMISRWGMCNIKDKSISFSVYLLLLPEWCVEHVVVHELCHLLEPSHNARFHALMDYYFPRWKEARKVTRQLERGHTIETALLHSLDNRNHSVQQTIPIDPSDYRDSKVIDSSSFYILAVAKVTRNTE